MSHHSKQEFTIVLHGNAKPGGTVVIEDGVKKRIEQGLLVRAVALWMRFETLEQAIDYARQVWKANKWPDVSKHIMIKQNMKIVFEAPPRIKEK